MHADENPSGASSDEAPVQAATLIRQLDDPAATPIQMAMVHPGGRLVRIAHSLSET